MSIFGAFLTLRQRNCFRCVSDLHLSQNDFAGMFAAVIPHKRIWSGQLDETEVLECLERYRPERMLLLSSSTNWPGLSDYVQAHYETDSGGSGSGWFWRRRDELSE